MPKRQPEAPEEIKPLGLSRKEWMNHVSELGCVACRVMGSPGTPAAIHHLRDGMGMSQRNDDYLSIALCPTHHQYGTREHPGIHSHPRAFVETYGTEVDLWLLTIQLVREKILRERLF